LGGFEEGTETQYLDTEAMEQEEIKNKEAQGEGQEEDPNL
jgi:hypothetical protein